MLRRSVPIFSGVSGLSVYVPPARVELKDWCDWTGNKWDKVSSVVGCSFRIPTANENAYTMAANAVVRLIVQNNVDPQQVGFLGLGTESSTDNSAGSVIVRGMVDQAMESLNLPRLSRNCEVPEFKHACLGGIYGLKNACRYTSADGGDAGKIAIVVASDIAEYALGSTGEQTQGAGAVAMLVEKDPKLFEIDLKHAGSSSAYRGPDFRKPHKRHFMTGYYQSALTADEKIPDFPVFSGPYSTLAYLDEVTQAVEDMLQKFGQHDGQSPGDFYHKVNSLFFHRPYHMMPVQSMSFLIARALARATSPDNKAKFEALCAKGKVAPEAVIAELNAQPDLYGYIERQESTNDVYKATQALAKAVRGDNTFTSLLEAKMSLGSKTMAHIGNLYTAALPCWVAAGFSEALTLPAEKKDKIAGSPMVLVGYGSGDASEAMPITPVPGWEQAAAKIGIDQALSKSVLLDKEQYTGIHSGSIKTDVAADLRDGEFTIGRIGQRNEPAFQDVGIEYYSFQRAAKN